MGHWGTCPPPLSLVHAPSFPYTLVKRIVFFLLPQAFRGLKYAENAIAAGAHDDPPDPVVVGWGADTPPHTHPTWRLLAPRCSRLRRLVRRAPSLTPNPGDATAVISVPVCQLVRVSRRPAGTSLSTTRQLAYSAAGACSYVYRQCGALQVVVLLRLAAAAARCLLLMSGGGGGEHGCCTVTCWWYDAARSLANPHSSQTCSLPRRCLYAYDNCTPCSLRSCDSSEQRCVNALSHRPHRYGRTPARTHARAHASHWRQLANTDAHTSHQTK